MKSTTAIAAATAAMKSGTILHAVDTSDCPITAGRVAVPGGEPTWCIFKYAPAGYGCGGEPVLVDDCGSPAAVARALCRTYLGAAKTMDAVERAP